MYLIVWFTLTLDINYNYNAFLVLFSSVGTSRGKKPSSESWRAIAGVTVAICPPPHAKCSLPENFRNINTRKIAVFTLHLRIYCLRCVLSTLFLLVWSVMSCVCRYLELETNLNNDLRTSVRWDAYNYPVCNGGNLEKTRAHDKRSEHFSFLPTKLAIYLV